MIYGGMVDAGLVFPQLLILTNLRERWVVSHFRILLSPIAEGIFERLFRLQCG